MAVSMNLSPKLQDRLQILKNLIPQTSLDHRVLESRLRPDTSAIHFDPSQFTTGATPIPDRLLPRLKFINNLSSVLDDYEPVVTWIASSTANFQSVRDVAIKIGPKDMAVNIDTAKVPQRIIDLAKTLQPPTTTDAETTAKIKQLYSLSLRKSLFDVEPSAVVVQMLDTGELKLGDVTTSNNIRGIIAKSLDWDLRYKSVNSILQNPATLSSLPENEHPNAIKGLQLLSRLQAISPSPEIMPALMQININSAFQVANMPKAAFLKTFKSPLGDPETAELVFANATNIKVRNEMMLLNTTQSIRGTGMKFIDGPGNIGSRFGSWIDHFLHQNGTVDMDTLFGDIKNVCDCDECLSVHSAAAYYVELLQFLRNNNLDPANANTNQKTLSGTLLERLFQRRPDLGYLKLTCKNTNTTMPYLDLAMEVMESFVAHAPTIDPFNVDGDATSAELLAEPRHVNLIAYKTLSKATFPSCALPYSLPATTAREFLKALGTTKQELLSCCRSSYQPAPILTSTPAELTELKGIFSIVQDRYADAEALEMSQEEYVVLTQESFYPKRWFQLIRRPGFDGSDAAYRKTIGFSEDSASRYGYHSLTDMLNTDQSTKIGLCFVQKQLLPRLGITYVELLSLCQTWFMNPVRPTPGSVDEQVIHGIRYSYRFLQSFVDYTETVDMMKRYQKLINFLSPPPAPPFIPIIRLPGIEHRRRILLEGTLSTDDKETYNIWDSWKKADWTRWILTWFDRIGKTLVMESGDGPKLPFSGELVLVTANSPQPPSPGPFNPGRLKIAMRLPPPPPFLPDIKIPIGLSPITGTPPLPPPSPIFSTLGLGNRTTPVFTPPALTFPPVSPIIQSPIHTPWWRDAFGNAPLTPPAPAEPVATMTVIAGIHDDGNITDVNGNIIGYVSFDGKLMNLAGKAFSELYPPPNNGLAVRPLNGDFLGVVDENGYLRTFTAGFPVVEWSGIKDKCSIEETVLKHLDGTPLSLPEWEKLLILLRLWKKQGWTVDETDCAIKDVPMDTATPPEIIHRLVKIKQLADLTALPVSELLPFWATLDGQGATASVYSQLFLGYNARNMDNIFMANGAGAFLSQNPSEKISAHVPILQAALGLSLEDIQAIIKFQSLEDKLTVASISTLYRFQTLARVLGVSSNQVLDIISLLGDPFASPEKTWDMLNLWQSIDSSGFDVKRLLYLCKDRDDLANPIAIPERSSVLAVKELRDIVLGINTQHKDLPMNTTSIPDAAIETLLHAELGLIYGVAEVDLIDRFLAGAGVYTTNAPKNLDIVVPSKLTLNFKYFATKGVIQVTGILSAQDLAIVKALGGSPTPSADWLSALDRIQKQIKSNFDQVIGRFSDFPSRVDVILTLMSADDLLLQPTGTTPDPVVVSKSASRKRRYFLQYFIPFLRKQLVTTAITASISTLVGLTNEVCQFLLSAVEAPGSPPKPALEAVIALGDASIPTAVITTWSGYLLPPTSGIYTFYIDSDTAPTQILLDMQTVVFTQQQDPTNLWISNPINLSGEAIYILRTPGSIINELRWTYGIVSREAIPPETFLAVDDKQKQVTTLLKTLQKFSILVNQLNLNIEEIVYLSKTQPINFSNFSIASWKRLQDYKAFANTIQPRDMSLVALFKWASTNDTSISVASAVSNATGWSTSSVDKLISNKSLQRSDFINETKLTELSKTVKLSQKVGIDIDILFQWSLPNMPGDFDSLNIISDQIQAASRKRFTTSEWNLAVKPVFDRLRSSRQSALVAYLLAQDSLKEKVSDVDSLFEYFLIDCQMSPLMETSRIKQAISTVQLFVQRCLLGLEEPLPANVIIDRQRWDALMNYRPWEASVKIRLWPENWCEPSIRDDKSPFFRDFESELMESGLSNASLLSAFKNYISKVHQISKLQACGIFIEQSPRVSWQYISNNRIHLFARTLSAPAAFFYRRYNVSDKTWSAWEDMKIDIPVYEDSNVTSNVEIGTYLIPTIYEGRLLVFFPQFCKKTTVSSENTPSAPGSDQALVRLKPAEMWEIKMCWSEYFINGRGVGKWSSKKASENAVYTPAMPVNTLGNRSGFRFIPNSSNGILKIEIIQNDMSIQIGRFVFPNKSFETQRGELIPTQWNSTKFHLYPINSNTGPENTDYQLNSFQLQSDDTNPFLYGPPYVLQPASTSFQHIRLFYEGMNHMLDIPQSSAMMGTISNQSVDPLADLVQLSNRPFAISSEDTFGGKELHELRYPNSIYFWEIGFHAIYHVADQLLKSQQFEAALKMCNKIFDPLEPESQAWKFPPFQSLAQSISSGAVQETFMNLTPGEADTRATEWRNHPFEPHVVARGTPVAYMKMVVMKYVEILLAWGDDYFRRNTLETIPSAMQCYIYASHIFGPRGQVIPRRGTKAAQTYMSLLNKWDALSNAMVELELTLPTNSSPIPLGGVSQQVTPVAPSGASNLFGFATTLYFCVPNNPQYNALRNTIDDRLFKIRNSQDIDGITRKLPLFEPPIDPALLIQAKASGQSIYNALSDLNTPISPYRFHLIVQKAIELCQEAISFSNQMLSIKERRDAESLALLQSQQENKMRSLIMNVRTQQLSEANAALDVLVQARATNVYRLKHQFKLLGIDSNTVPAEEADFQELQPGVDPPVRNSPVNMIAEEKQQIDLLDVARDLTIGVGAIEAFVATLHSLPNISINCEPWGVGASVSAGPEQLGAWFTAAARALQAGLTLSEIKSRGLGFTATAKRQAWDRFHQANISGYEVKGVDKQLIAQRIRINIAAKEIENQQQSIDHATELADFLHSKYTNRELYSWMEGSVRSVHHQAYLFAYDMALKAQKAYRYERPNETANFISSGYWNSDKDGLLASQFLLNDLRKLQAASQEKRGYDFEMVKHISLRQWCPLAFLNIRETGTGEFEFPEMLFDMDFPGHYLRRISSVSVSIPCVVGPYTSINATVRLLHHKYRIRADATDYPEKVQENGDKRFATTLLPNNALALSSGINDSGRLDLKAAADMYNPIEGAGVISGWHLELPSAFRQFDYSTIPDIIFHINYTSLNGGDGLKAAASASVSEYIKTATDLSRDQGLFALVNLKADYATQWYREFHPPIPPPAPGTTPAPINVTLNLDKLQSYVPAFARHASQVVATDIYLLSPGAFQSSLTVETTTKTFGAGSGVGKMNVLAVNGTQVPVTEWTLKFTGVSSNLEGCWMLWRYAILVL